MRPIFLKCRSITFTSLSRLGQSKNRGDILPPMTLTRFALVLSLLLALSVPGIGATIYVGAMVGTNEVPANSSTATGFTTVAITGNEMIVDVTWSGLIGGNPMAAHIHCCTDVGTNIGVAVGFPAFPATVNGTYNHSFNLLDPAIYTTSFLNNFGGGTAAGARSALIAGLDAGRAYSNIHNSTFPGGEIRGALEPAPEPQTLTLLTIGALAMGAFRRRSH